MKQFEIKALGLEELSAKEATLLNGGTVIRYYTGSNELIYAGNALVNGCKYIYHGLNNLFGGDDVLTYETFGDNC